MRRIVLSLTLATLLLMAGCIAPLQTDGATSATADAPTISVTGTGEVTADADLAVVMLSVVASADSAEDARADAAARTDALLAALSDAGFAEDEISSVGYAIYPEYDYRESGRELLGYRAVHSFQGEIAPEQAGTFIDTAVGAAGVTVSSVSFTLSDETRESLREQALTRAMANARADADTIAAAGDLTVVGVATASTSGGPFTPFFDVRYAGDEAAGSPTTFRPGPVTVSATVSVTYEAR